MTTKTRTIVRVRGAELGRDVGDRESKDEWEQKQADEADQRTTSCTSQGKARGQLIVLSTKTATNAKILTGDDVLRSDGPSTHRKVAETDDAQDVQLSLEVLLRGLQC
jgi:hypothetical protein